MAIRCASVLLARVSIAVGSAAAVAVTLTPAGCVATVQDRPSRASYVAGPPPLPLSEFRPAPPAPGFVWVPGYWHWSDVQYAWVPGHWETPPAGVALANGRSGP